MSALQPGQRVKVEFEGVVQSVRGERMVYVKTDERGASWAYVPRFSITQLGPANWPPQVGDLWEVDGEEYVCRNHRSLSGERVLASIDAGTRNGSKDYFERDFRDLAARGPVLVRRRGQ